MADQANMRQNEVPGASGMLQCGSCFPLNLQEVIDSIKEGGDADFKVWPREDS